MYYLAAPSYKRAQIAALYINAGNGNWTPTRVLLLPAPSYPVYINTVRASIHDINLLLTVT